MDPNLFHLDWARTLEVLAAVVVLSFVLERGLAILFEHRLFIAKADKKGLKEPIAFVVAALVCVMWDFDAVSMIFLTEKTTVLGEVVTAGIVAGGSKGSIRLFRDVLKIRSNAQMEKDERDKSGATPDE